MNYDYPDTWPTTGHMSLTDFYFLVAHLPRRIGGREWAYWNDEMHGNSPGTHWKTWQSKGLIRESESWL